MQSSEKKRNQRKSPLTPKKSFKKEESPPVITTRVGGRLKKAKIPFDPSTYFVTKRRQTEPFLPIKKLMPKKASQANGCCHCKKLDKPETFVHCRGCDTRIHITCLQSICERFGKHEEETWECQMCQICSICNKNNSDDDFILKCYNCFNYFHSKCHGQLDKSKILKENRFSCRSCVSEKNQKSIPGQLPKKTRAFAQTRTKPAPDNKFSNDRKQGFLGFNANELQDDSTDDECNEPKNIMQRRCDSAEQQSTQINKRSSISSEQRSIDDERDIPDATDWSTDEVFKYFQAKFPRHAHVFKDHEIDGPSLYLLKRGDIVRGLNIELGPALKIYGHIVKLQTKSNDPTLSWQ